VGFVSFLNPDADVLCVKWVLKWPLSVSISVAAQSLKAVINGWGGGGVLGIETPPGNKM